MNLPAHELTPRIRKPDRGYDLHVHTTHSDGVCSPCEVVVAAARVGLAGLAITDHDTVTAVEAAQGEAERLGVELVPGVEMSATHEGVEYHLLGYFLDPDERGLRAAFDSYREARAERSLEIGRKLQRLGFRVDTEQVAATSPRNPPGRRHFAEWLVRGGQLATRRLAFQGLLEAGGPAYVPKAVPDSGEAIDLLRAAGGIVGLAHPPRDLTDRTLATFVERGLEALEVRFPGLPAGRQQRLDERCRRFGLVPVGGSDFHDPARPGGWVGRITTEAKGVELLRQRAGSGRERAQEVNPGWPDRTNG